MSTTSARYGRPKGSGLDDSRQLESLAALLAANPALKPTTAIRSLGIEEPSTIRRLRDKFRMDQARLMADARRTYHAEGRIAGRPVLVHSTARRPLASIRAPMIAAAAAAATAPALAADTATSLPAAPPAPDKAIAARVAQQAPQPPLLAAWLELGVRATLAAIEQQAVLASHLLHHPAVETAVKGQLAVGAFCVAVMTPRKPLKPRLH